MSCGYRSESEQNQIYFELEVPPNGSNLSSFVEQTFNEGCMVDIIVKMVARHDFKLKNVQCLNLTDKQNSS